jgi:hypothetical protein
MSARAVREHEPQSLIHDEYVAPAYERMLGFPVLTRVGNLNNVPAVICAMWEAASNLTYRRRLVVFQQATGIGPPSLHERHECPS